jgi:CoA:oxalate CoA-transferase
MRSMLEGVRVIDFTTTVSGPGCSFFLADMGAEVIKVERPVRGDDARMFPPYQAGISAAFVTLNRGKRGVTMDLKQPRGVELFKELVAVSDVLVENFIPGNMARLGLDYDTLKEINPRLVMCSISGYGQYGPLSDQPGYDAVIQAVSGMMSTTGDPDRPPMRAGTLIVDISTAFTAAFGICAALFAREITGEGEYLDVALYDVAINLLEAKFVDYTVTGNVPQRTGNRYAYVTPFDLYPTADSNVFIICAGDGPFAKLCEAMGRPELAQDERFSNLLVRNVNEPALKEIIEGWTSQYSTDDLMAILQPAGVPAAPVNDVGQVIANPHTRERGMLVDVEQPGAGTITIFGSPIKPRASEMRPRGPAPTLGQHNRWLLEELLGKDEAEAEEIISSGAMG